MKVLNKLTIKNLKLNKKRTIVTVIGIMLSVALITAVASMYSSLVASLIRYEVAQKGHFHVVYYDVPSQEIETFRNNRQIQSLYLTQNIGYAKLENSKNDYKPYAYVKAFTKESLENLSVKLVDGRLPENNNEILIPTHLKTNGRVELNIGEKITLDIGRRVDTEDGVELNQSNPLHLYDVDDESYEELGFSSVLEEKIVDTTTKTYKIVGIIERPASNIESYSAPGYTFITYLDDNNITGNMDIFAEYTKKGSKNYLNVTANILDVDEEAFRILNTEEVSKLTQDEVSKLYDRLGEIKYDYAVNDYLIMLENNPIKAAGIGGLETVIAIVCVIIVITSVFCIKNSFDISITEKTKQYGMLRSVGATKKQIRKNVFYEATILGAIGIPLGIVAGILASVILVYVVNIFLASGIGVELEFVFKFSIIAIILAIILGIVTIYLSAIRSAFRASKVSPIESIRNSANIKIKAKKIKGSKIINKLFGIGGQISYKNLKRNKKKYRTTVISIIVSVAVFIALTGFMNSAFYALEDELNLFDYNLTVLVNEKEGFDKAVETTTLAGIKDYSIYRDDVYNIPNVKYNTEYLLKTRKTDKVKDNSFVLTIASIGEEQYNKYIKSLGLKYEDVKDKAILFDDIEFNFSAQGGRVESSKMRQFAYKRGDVIEGNIEDKDVNLEIAYVANELPFGLPDHDYMSMIIVSDELFDSIAKSNNMTIYYDTENANKLQDEVEEMLAEVSCSINNVDEEAKIMNNMFTLIGIFLYGFIIVISLIGITNIFNTITTNMELRRQEFAMLKSIGMTKKEFSRMIRLESIFMGVKSLLFGLPIGMILAALIAFFLSEGNIKSLGIKYLIPFNGIIISVIAVFLLITCIMGYSMSKINKQNIIETIRNENI